ncbi:MAG: alpha-amylase family glycosyl hydrolase [Anaerostipes sp.]|nr:alpha-amylase family glycosyl hydrolase [Anaerostipes sp.]
MNELIFYQFFPLRAFVDKDSEGIVEVKNWIPHLKKLGVNAVYFSPIFESSYHGYDTKDYMKVDGRLGTNEDFREVCDALHKEGIKVILDGVFNHVGREFWAFQDVIEKKWDSPYKDWFFTNFDGNSNYDDGFWYEGWEGHFELVKLNLDHPDLRAHLFDAVGMWIDELGIDGLRLDVAYMLNRNFMKLLVDFAHEKKEDFIFIGEMLHGDYSTLANHHMLDSVTNYECYKGLYSSFNTHNMHEIGYSLNRQFGPDDWSLYKGIPLYNFVDNHDVIRIATQLIEIRQLPLIYALLYAMPGVPAIYYGSEWGIQGAKGMDNDDDLRPRIKEPVENPLFDYISKLSEIRKESKALQYGNYVQKVIHPDVLIFTRECDEEKLLFAVNIGDVPYTAHFDIGSLKGEELIQGKDITFEDGLEIPPMTAYFILQG